MRKRSAGEERRLVAAGAGPDLEDRVLLVVRVAGNQQQPHLPLELRLALAEALELRAGHLRHLGVRVGQHGLGIRDLGERAAVARAGLDDRPQPGQLAGHLGIGLPVAGEARVGELLLELPRVLLEHRDLVQQVRHETLCDGIAPPGRRLDRFGRDDGKIRDPPPGARRGTVVNVHPPSKRGRASTFGEGGVNVHQRPLRLTQEFIDSRNSSLLSVALTFSSRNSIESTGDSGCSTLRRMYIRLSVASGSRSSSRRVAERLMSMAG